MKNCVSEGGCVKNAKKKKKKEREGERKRNSY